MTGARACAACRLEAEVDEVAEWESNEAFYYWPRSTNQPLTLTAHQGKRLGSCAEIATEPREGGAG